MIIFAIAADLPMKIAAEAPLGSIVEVVGGESLAVLAAPRTRQAHA